MNRLLLVAASALALAACSDITHIQVTKDLGTVTLEAPIHYTGAQQPVP